MTFRPCWSVQRRLPEAVRPALDSLPVEPALDVLQVELHAEAVVCAESGACPVAVVPHL